MIPTRRISSTARRCWPTSIRGWGSRRSAPTRGTRTTCGAAPNGWPRRLRAAGFPTVEVWETRRAARGVRRMACGAIPTPRVVVVYGHHDVQPVEPLEQWETPAVRADECDGASCSAAGASDDKGQVLFHLLGLRGPPGGRRPHRAGRSRSSCWSRARRSPARRTSPTCCGSDRDRLACDVVVVSDTGDVRPRTAVHVHRHARHDRLPDRPARARRSTCTRDRSAARVPNPLHAHGRGCWPGCTTMTAG